MIQQRKSETKDIVCGKAEKWEERAKRGKRDL